MTPIDHLIAAHIARHGVTRGPAAIVAPTSVELTPSDIEAHRARPSQFAPCRFGGGWRGINQPKTENRRGNKR